jgi:hypothetical protein
MNYNYYSEGQYRWRDGVRSGNYVIDYAITAAGFGGALGTDWVNVTTLIYS